MAPNTGAMVSPVEDRSGDGTGTAGGDSRADGEVPALDPAAVAWRFRAGSPSPGVAVAEDGTVYVPTHEGHVLSLSAEGRLRWAYNVQTPAVGAVVVPGGGLVVGTQDGKLHSLRADGTRIWSLQLPFSFATELVLGAGGLVLFGDRSGAVAAVDRFGAVRSRWPISGGLGAPPLALPGGGAAALSTEGRLFWVGAGPARSIELGVAASGARLTSRAGDLLAITERGLLVVRGGSVARRLPPVAAVVARGDGFVTVSSAGVLSFRSRDGEVEVEHRLVAPPSAELAVDAAGIVYVPTTTGALVAATPAAVRPQQVTGRALLSPVLDPGRGRLILASGDGSVLAAATEGLAP